MEVRATAPGVLNGLGLLHKDRPNGEPKHGGLISIVVEKPHGAIRPLPRLYLGALPLFASREMDAVRAGLRKLLRAVTDAAAGEPVYVLFACMVDGQRGIYAGNSFNRSRYLRTLTRLGMSVSSDPYRRLASDGLFQHEEGEPFRPSFVLLGDGAPDDGVNKVRDGQLLFRVASRRLGILGEEELRVLAKTLEGLEGISTSDPREALAAALAP